MATGFFSNFGNVWFPISASESIWINDTTKAVGFLTTYTDNPALWLNYTIKDGESPEMLSERMYGTVDYWWIILAFNNIIDVYSQWPIDKYYLSDYIEDQYPLNNVLTDIHHWIMEDGSITDPVAIGMVKGISREAAITSYNLSSVTINDYETILNDNKRFIKILDPDYIEQVLSDLQSAFA